MQGVVAAVGQVAIHGHHVGQPADLARHHDPVVREPDLLGGLGRREGASHHGLSQHVRPRPRLWQAGVLLHQRVHELGVKRAGVDADAHGLTVVDGGLDHLGEVAVVPGPPAHVARVDPELGEGVGHLRELTQQRVAVVVEVAHHRHVHVVHVAQALHDLGHHCRGLAVVHGDTHDLGAGAREFGHLRGGAGGILGVGVGHGLDHHRGAATHRDVAHHALRAHASGPFHGPGV